MTNNSTPPRPRPKPAPRPKAAERALESNKIAIIGMAPSSRGLAPYADPDWEIWTLSTAVSCGHAPRFDRHFELHPLRWFRERADQGDEYLAWLRSIEGKPVYLQETDETIPAGVLFPKSEVVEHFGTYFTNTVSWMIAFAIAEGATTIGVWGVDMAQNAEYANQRPSCEFFLGWARGAGIKVYIPEQADLLKCPGLYGFDTDTSGLERLWKARQQELQQRLGRKVEIRDHAALECAALQGALDSQQYYRQWFSGQACEAPNGNGQPDQVPT
jgi:hypothetical protein